ncbi:MAG: hypothetical protein ACRD4A_00810 [Candidatus Acidiferrales bacterium]
MSLSGPGIYHVDQNSIRVMATADGDIVRVDGRSREAFGGHLQWEVNFTIKSGPGFKQQGGDILWMVRYECDGNRVERQFRQTVYCL